MANFTFNGSLGITTDDGIALASTVTGVSGNAKQLLDDEFDPATSVDLAPLVASMADPTWFILLLDGDGAQLNFDGIGLTTKAYKSFVAQLSPNTPGPSGVFDLLVLTQGAKQRVEFLAVGNE